MHICRGNFRSTYFTTESYDPVAETIFSKLQVDALFLEFDDQRSGGFQSLKYCREDLVIVLGLITSKTAALEDKEFIKQRIYEATQYVPLERLRLSPQCGFASTEEGNLLTEAEQWRKLSHVIEIPKEVWGSND